MALLHEQEYWQIQLGLGNFFGTGDLVLLFIWGEELKSTV